VTRRTLQNLNDKKVILLFYKEYETDKFVKYDRYLKRILRPLYHLSHRRQKKSGFAVSFDLMCRALVRSGFDVRVNDYRTARHNPDYPVGLIGFPLLLENWTLPNPAVLGPSLYDHPLLAPDLMRDTRFKKYVVLAPWTLNLFAPVYGDACFSWFAGIDLVEWPDQSAEPKTYDFLIYDKIHWNHDEQQKALIDPIVAALEAKGLSYKIIRYKMYDHATYKELLKNVRAMLFLSHHETQGLAYQEAMASNVPILAWDKGVWTDPLWKKFASEPPATSSVPFFSSACGETFRDITEFKVTLDRFIEKRSTYRPRDYVAQNLSMDASAKLYADHYFSLLPNR